MIFLGGFIVDFCLIIFCLKMIVVSGLLMFLSALLYFSSLGLYNYYVLRLYSHQTSLNITAIIQTDIFHFLILKIYSQREKKLNVFTSPQCDKMIFFF